MIMFKLEVQGALRMRSMWGEEETGPNCFAQGELELRSSAGSGAGAEVLDPTDTLSLSPPGTISKTEEIWRVVLRPLLPGTQKVVLEKSQNLIMQVLPVQC